MCCLKRLKTGVVGLLLGAVLGFQALGAVPSDRSGTIVKATLPLQAAKTYQLILQGGPFEHEKDGLVFGNR
jgi:ribonuclease T1